MIKNYTFEGPPMVGHVLFGLETTSWSPGTRGDLHTPRAGLVCSLLGPKDLQIMRSEDTPVATKDFLPKEHKN